MWCEFADIHKHNDLDKFLKKTKRKKIGACIHTTGSGWVKHSGNYEDGYKYLIDYYKKGFSSQFLISRKGEISQFIPADSYAPHCGISSVEWSVLKRGFEWWSRFRIDTLNNLKYEKYNKLKANGWYSTKDQKSDPVYSYWIDRWANVDPLTESPNYTYIGIDFQAYIKKSDSYSNSQYGALEKLVNWFIEKNILKKDLIIVGHEDLNPLTRPGWDPGPLFDWSKVEEIKKRVKSVKI